MTIPLSLTDAAACKQKRLSRCSLWAVWLIALATPAFAQSFHFGVKAGVPMTDYFQTGRTGARNRSAEYSSATRRYTVGASAELRLRHGLGVELDALYKRMGYVGVVRFGPGIVTTSAFDAKGGSWDIPLMAKFRFGLPVVRPYVAGGGVLRYIGPVRARGTSTVENLITGTTVTTPIDTKEPSDLRKRIYPGLTRRRRNRVRTRPRAPAA